MRDAASHETEPCSEIIIGYASQTGQAEAISELVYDRLASVIHECQRDPLPKITKSVLNAIEATSLQKPGVLAVFIASTTGEGEPPENALKFWRKLRRLSPKDQSNSDVKLPLSVLQYSILGLGDTNYNRFCAYAKDLNKKLTSLGAQKLQDCLPAWADDAVGLEQEVEPWLDKLIPAALYRCGAFVKVELPRLSIPKSTPSHLSTSVNMAEPETKLVYPSSELSDKESLVLPLIPSKTKDVIVTPSDKNADGSFEFHNLPVMDSPFYDAYVQQVRELTNPNVPGLKEEDRKIVYETSIKIMKGNSDTDFSYVPGDSFGFICGNHDEEVDDLLKLVILPQDVTPTTLVTVKGLPHMPARALPLIQLIKFHCEIRAVIKKNALRHLATFASNPSEERRLLELSSREGANQYAELIRGHHINLLDVLRMFSSCRPPLEVVMLHLPPFCPRYYSVTTSQLDAAQKYEFKTAFTLAQFKSSAGLFGRNEHSSLGVFTGQIHRLYLDEKSSGDNLADDLSKLSTHDTSESSKSQVQYSIKKRSLIVFKRKNQHFKLPDDIRTPLLMVGPGTGVAPFLSFLTHRHHQQQRNTFTRAGESNLVFTCRHADHDFIYKDLIESFVSDKTITNLVSGASRDPSKPSIHVQDLIKESAAVEKFLTRVANGEDGRIYICGDLKSMSVSVFNALAVVLAKISGHDAADVSGREESVKLLRQLQADKKFLEDIWT